MAIDLTSMSTAQLNQLRIDLENGTATDNQINVDMVLEELEFRNLNEDTVMISSATKTEGTEETEDSTGIDTEAVAETQASIDADMAILSEYDDRYNALLQQQIDLETQCKNFDYGDLEKVQSSGEASQILKKVEGQIKRIERLIKTTESAIRTLEEQKQVAEGQLEKREAEKEQFEAEMEQLNEKIKSNEELAEAQTEQYKNGADKEIEKYAKEFQLKNLGAHGIDMNEWISQQMANYQLPESVSNLFAENDTLIGQLNTKGEQLKLVSGAIDTLTAKIESLDKNLETQNNKLTDYNKNLDGAKQYRDGVIQTRDAWKEVERARRKKKKRGLGGLINRLVRAATNLVKSVVKGVKNLIKNITGAVGGVMKFAGKFTGDILKPLGMEGLCEGIGNAAAAATEFVGATATFDKDEMKESLKNLEDSAEQAVESKIFKQAEKYGKKVGNAACDAWNDTVQGVGRLAGNIADEAFGAVGGIVDRWMGLDSLGNGIAAVGETVEGTTDMAAGALTGDKDLIQEGWDNTKDNAIDAGLTVAKVAAAVYTGGAAGLIDLAVSEAATETGRSVGEDIGGTVGGIVGGVVGAAMGSGYDSLKGADFDLGAVADRAVTSEGVGNFVAEVGKGSLKNAAVVGGTQIAEELGVDEDIAGFIGAGTGMLYDSATDGTTLDADRQHFSGNVLGDAAEQLGLTEIFNTSDETTNNPNRVKLDK
ncbi:hypothetical protein IJE86_02600 [bacterium]|nr:hypothetical protein [bacterium]